MDSHPASRAWKATADFDNYLSGDYEEHVFGVDRGEFRCVLFSDEDELEPWVGRFSADGLEARKPRHYECCSPTQVHRVGNSAHFHVLVEGHLYTVNAQHRTLAECRWVGDFRGLIHDPVRHRFIGWTYDDIVILDFGGREIHRRELSYDDYYDMQLWPDAVKGVAWVNYAEYRRFEFNLDTFRVTWKECVEPGDLGLPG